MKKNTYPVKLKSLDELKGMRPNVMQRRPNAPKPSPVKPFNLHRQKGD